MLESKLFGHKTIKVNGVRFLIRKLSPSLFLDKDYLFPMSSVAEKSKKNNRKISEKELLKCTEEFKDKMRDTILKSVISLKKSFFSKSQSINSYIDEIMENPELYSYIFTLIVNHSLGLKKKKISSIDRTFAKTIYIIAKTYNKLPTEIIYQDNDAWCMNALITSIGREEEYRENLLSILEGYNIKTNQDTPIKNLERLVEQQRNKSNAKK